MATPPFGGFADLSRYIAEANQPTVSPLDALLQGVQQGVALRQLPQQIQQNALEQQLAAAIQTARLRELQNPQLAAQRRLQEAAIEGIISGRNPSLIFQPTISPELQAMRETALRKGGVPPPVSDFQELVPAIEGRPAIGISRTAGEAATKAQREAKIAEIEARYAIAGIPTRRGVDEFGNEVLIPTRVIPGQAASTIPVLGPGGAPLKAATKTTTTKSLTPNAQTSLLSQAAAAGIDPDNPKYINEETGAYDFIKLAIDKGRATREQKRVENATKAAELTGKTKSDIEALNAAENQLHFLQNEIDEVSQSGKTPGFLDNVIAAGTATPPSGYFGAVVQQLAKGLQSEESKELEGRKTIISSALRKAISGLAVTNQEATQLGFLPRPGDSFEELVRKAAVLEEYINNQRAGLSGQVTPRPGAETPNIPTTPTPVRSGNTFRIIR